MENVAQGLLCSDLIRGTLEQQRLFADFADKSSQCWGEVRDLRDALSKRTDLLHRVTSQDVFQITALEETNPDRSSLDYLVPERQ